VEREWRPEPTPEEREALDRALARLLAEGGETRTAWWREGIRESVEPDGDPPSRGEGAS
jgi:hypothetical protein